MYQVSINPNSERFDDWLKVFGTDTVIACDWGFANVIGKRTEVFMLALDRLTPEQYEKLVAHLAQRFNEPLENVQRDIRRHGVPLLAKDVTHIREVKNDFHL